MLTKAYVNYDKNNRKLLLDIARTEWSQTSYVWSVFGKVEGNELEGNKYMKQYAMGIGAGKNNEMYLPNSLCLHLIIETKDDEVVLSRISQIKINDNPGTWAATLGEQLDKSDFTDNNNFKDKFISIWVKRAFNEEYKFDDANYEAGVDEDSIRVLSVDFESDRYNFALCCTVRLRYSFSRFSSMVATKLDTNEAMELKPLPIKDIPKLLLEYNDPKKRKLYHPSTFLRLLMLYLYKNGYARAENNIVEESKKIGGILN